MTRYLHTMYRITDPEKSRSFYEALGLEFRRESPIVRNGDKEATLYFFGVPGQDEELELTLNHDGRSYDLGSGYGHIVAFVWDDEARTEEHAELRRGLLQIRGVEDAIVVSRPSKMKRVVARPVAKS